MNWNEAAMIMFSCVMANYLGLVNAVEDIIKRPLPVINCPKCFTFWSVLAYMMWHVGFSDAPLIVTTSFLFSYLSVWLQLLFGIIDKLFDKIYEQIYPTVHTDNDGTQL